MVFIYKKKLKYFSYKKFQFLDYFPIVKKKRNSLFGEHLNFEELFTSSSLFLNGAVRVPGPATCWWPRNHTHSS